MEMEYDTLIYIFNLETLRTLKDTRKLSIQQQLLVSTSLMPSKMNASVSPLLLN